MNFKQKQELIEELYKELDAFCASYEVRGTFNFHYCLMEGSTASQYTLSIPRELQKPMLAILYCVVRQRCDSLCYFDMRDMFLEDYIKMCNFIYLVPVSSFAEFTAWYLERVIPDKEIAFKLKTTFKAVDAGNGYADFKGKKSMAVFGAALMNQFNTMYTPYGVLLSISKDVPESVINTEG